MSADWRGRFEQRIRWLRLRREWGRMCYITDCTGRLLDSWWEWEFP